MARAREERSSNTFRFMPGRKEAAEDGRTIFSGIRYSRRAVVDAQKGFLAGVAIGPGQHMPKDETGLGFQLSKGGVIVPAYPNEQMETVPVRDFVPPNEKNGRAKQYVDWATFQKYGDGMFRVVPFMEEQVVYGEFWTGDYDESEAAYQLIQADMFAHGSVAFAGGTVVIDAPSAAKTGGVQEPGSEEQSVRASQAELLSERKGKVVAGRPLWIARLFRIHFSEKDSEAILVRQLNRYYLVLVENGAVTPREVPADRYAKHFERLMGDELTAAAA
jgi:hypothetical protein